MGVRIYEVRSDEDNLPAAYENERESVNAFQQGEGDPLSPAWRELDQRVDEDWRRHLVTRVCSASDGWYAALVNARALRWETDRRLWKRDHTSDEKKASHYWREIRECLLSDEVAAVVKALLRSIPEKRQHRLLLIPITAYHVTDPELQNSSPLDPVIRLGDILSQRLQPGKGRRHLLDPMDDPRVSMMHPVVETGLAADQRPIARF